MAARVRPRLTAAEGRRFGLTVGLAFLALAGILWWRGHATTATVLATLGGTLVVAGLLIPTLLGPVEGAWMALAHAISRVTTPIVMGLMYAVVITPVGALRRAFGGNPLEHASADGSYWRTRPEGKRRSNSLSRQF